MPGTLNFTFDDGPDETWTPLVLEQLERWEVTATFFMVAERVQEHPALARTVLAAGHEVQLHCHRHVRHTELTEAQLQLDADSALAALASIGAQPRLWRAPWGVCTDASTRVAERLALRLVGWSIDTHDWRGDAPQAMLAHVLSQISAGGAVLMHDALGPGTRRSGCQNTLALLPMLASAARDNGLAVEPMGLAVTPTRLAGAPAPVAALPLGGQPTISRRTIAALA
jgi:peptidoglycan-N-acetylglucosamine deacetylase